MSFAAAHRGLSDEHPENTVAAFRAAVDAGFRCLELDVRTTSDGEVVVLHDAGIERTTNGNGRVADMRYDELRTYNAGTADAPAPVPRLDGLFSELADFDGLWNVEVKAPAATEHAIDLIEHHGLVHRTLLSSMHPKVLRRALERCPDLQRGLIVLGALELEDLEEAEELGCAWINPDHEGLGDDVLREVRARGYKVGCWTVNDPDRARHLVEQGVECIITDTRAVHEAVDALAW